jgi:SPP1 gp7 family putative phage head morphogenesis protein
VLQLVEQEGPVKARGLIFGLLAAATIAELGMRFKELELHADMLARLEQIHDEPIRANVTQTPIFTALPFDEAVDFFRRKQVMTPDEFAQLEDRYKSKGFSMAEVHSRYVIEAAHDALDDAIAKGASESETLKRVRDGFAAAGVATPEDYHLQTTFDQAVLGSYAAGRYAKLTDPDVLAARPIWQYTTAGDSRVRPAHRAMNRRTFPADSPVWATWFPPNGWRCRCSVLSLSNDQVAEAGLKVEDSVPPVVEHDGQLVNMLPDPGFSGSPATQLAADRTVAAIDQEADRTGALRQVPDDLNRAADAKRRAKVDAFAGLDDKGVEERFKDAFVWNAEDAPETRPGLLTVDWHMYSQNLDSAEQLVTRLVQTDGLYPLKDRAGVAARATFFGEWDPAKWTDPEVVYDDELAAKLGRPKGMTVARSTEYALRLFVKPAELEQTLAFLDENGERTGQGKHPVRRAWDIQDVRVHAPAGVAQPEGDRWKKAVRNVRALPSGKQMVTLSRAPLDGWRHEPVTVNASLWEFLP